jgi:GH15 family glucan-1,4-alpha-glucosidase
MWVDGTPYWNGVQLDETAFPILLADLAHRTGASNDDAWRNAWPMVRRAAIYAQRIGVDGYYVRIAPPEVADAASPAESFVAARRGDRISHRPLDDG